MSVATTKYLSLQVTLEEKAFILKSNYKSNNKTTSSSSATAAASSGGEEEEKEESKLASVNSLAEKPKHKNKKEQLQQQKNKNSEENNSYYVIQTTAGILDENQVDILRSASSSSSRSQEEEQEIKEKLIKQPPRGFHQFHRVGPLKSSSSSSSSSGGRVAVPVTSTCNIPIVYQNNPTTTTTSSSSSELIVPNATLAASAAAGGEQQKQEETRESSNNNKENLKEGEEGKEESEEQQKMKNEKTSNNNNNNNNTTSKSNKRVLCVLIQLVEINPDLQCEDFVGESFYVLRELPSDDQFFNAASSSSSVPLIAATAELPVIEMNIDSNDEEDGDENNNNNQPKEHHETKLKLKLRNVTTLFESPLSYISDPGPPRLRFLGNLPHFRDTRRAMQKLYGFTHVAAASYHTLQYVLQLTNTPNESGNIVFGPKRLLCLEAAISRGYGGLQPLFRFSLMRQLDVSNTFFGDVGFAVVLSSVHLCQRIEELKISNCGFTARTVPLIVQLLMRHDGLEFLDITHNNLLEKSGEDLMRLPRNNTRITGLNAREGNGFSKYVNDRLDRYCRENLETFNEDPLNPFGRSCSYLKDSSDISSENWRIVSEIWLALTTLPRSSHQYATSNADQQQLIQFGSGGKSNNNNSSLNTSAIAEIDKEDEDIRHRFGISQEQEDDGEDKRKKKENDNNNNNERKEDDFLIPPSATAPLLSQVWWRAFEQVVSKIDDPMILLCFAPLAKPTTTKKEAPKKKKKKETKKTEGEGEENQQEEETGEEEQKKENEENDNEEEEEAEEEEFLQVEEKDKLLELEQLNDVLRYKARQQFQSTLLRAFVSALPFAPKSWYHVSNTLLGVGESLRNIGVSMVDLRRFHLALVNALKVELGATTVFDVQKQSAWVQASSLIFRTLMDMP